MVYETVRVHQGGLIKNRQRVTKESTRAGERPNTYIRHDSDIGSILTQGLAACEINPATAPGRRAVAIEKKIPGFLPRTALGIVLLSHRQPKGADNRAALPLFFQGASLLPGKRRDDTKRISRVCSLPNFSCSIKCNECGLVIRRQ